MKKLILATAVVALFTACNSTTEADIETSDSVLSQSVDSISIINDTIKAADSIKPIVDTLKK